MTDGTPGLGHEAELGFAPRDTRAFWQTKACGTGHTTSEPGTTPFFEEADRFRYGIEPVAQFADFSAWKGRRVLEIGTGMGGDLVRFLRGGARATGVDLSPTAVETTRRRLELDGRRASVTRGDALHLPIRSASVDLVWSWGVLHHTGDIAGSLAEVRRVLQPGGSLRAMLYHRPSWVALAAWTRWSLFAGKPLRGIKQAVAEHIESPGTLALTVPEIRALLTGFEHVEVRVVGTHWDRTYVPVIGRIGGSRLGWFALVSASKTQDA